MADRTAELGSEPTPEPSPLLRHAISKAIASPDVEARLQEVGGTERPTFAVANLFTDMLWSALVYGRPALAPQLRHEVSDADKVVGEKLHDIVGNDTTSDEGRSLTTYYELQRHRAANRQALENLAAQSRTLRLRKQNRQAAWVLQQVESGEGTRKDEKRYNEEIAQLEADEARATEQSYAKHHELINLDSEVRRLEIYLNDPLRQRVPNDFGVVVEKVEKAALALANDSKVVETLRAEALKADEQHAPTGVARSGSARSTTANVGTSEDRSLELRVRMVDLRRSERRRRRLATQYIMLGLGVGIVAAILAILLRHSKSGLLLAVMYAVIGPVAGLAGYVTLRARGQADAEERLDAQNELDLLTIGVDQPEARAYKLLQVNQSDLKRYYDQTLRQGQNIFYVGISCILIGFAVIGVSLGVVESHPSGRLESQIVVAALGVVAGILANFIAVVYLRMYSATIQSVATFHNRLVGTHDLYFANLLSAMVADGGRRQVTLAAMATQIAGRRSAGEVEALDDSLRHDAASTAASHERG